MIPFSLLCSQLHGKSLIETNISFLEKHKGQILLVFSLCTDFSIIMKFPFFFPADSLIHRAAAAEMLFVLKPDKKAEAIKLIEDSNNNLVST